MYGVKSELPQHKQNLIVNQADTWGERREAISFHVHAVQYYRQLSKPVTEAIFVCQQAPGASELQ